MGDIRGVLEVILPGPYATVQDLGRPGYAHLGVPRSGAADGPALRLANRLVGNPEGYAGVELTFGGARLRASCGVWIAVTGAPCPVEVGGADDRSGVPGGDRSGHTSGLAGGAGADTAGGARADAAGGAGSGSAWRRAGMDGPVWVAAGQEIRIGMPWAGLRSYLAVRGGIAVEPVLGSRSGDSLSGLGPAPLAPGSVLPIGRTDSLPPMTVDQAPPRPISNAPAVRVLPGPRDDWFVPGALDELSARPYAVSPDSNRVGVRLRGSTLKRARQGELPSEGMVAGAIQVPPDGLPIVFLADHPPTGGYPVIGVVAAADLPAIGQLRPGDHLRFKLTR